MMLATRTRFEKYVQRTSTCWNWTGYAIRTPLHKGGKLYGRFKHAGKNDYAHRYVYEQTYGPLPEGAQVHHWCLNSLCVRPDHLGCAYTQAEHVLMEKESRGQLKLLTEFDCGEIQAA